MKNSKYLIGFFSILMLSLVSIGFVSCSDDDDDDEKSTVVGTWSNREGSEALTLKFNSNGSGVATATYYDSYSGKQTETMNFTYVMLDNESGIMTWKYYDSYYGELVTESISFEVYNNKLYLYEDANFGELMLILNRN